MVWLIDHTFIINHYCYVFVLTNQMQYTYSSSKTCSFVKFYAAKSFTVKQKTGANAINIFGLLV